MSKLKTINKINSSWDNLLNTISSFSSKHEKIPGAVGTWSLLESVIHIFAWDNELLTNLKDYHEKKEMPRWIDLSDQEIVEFNQNQVNEFANAVSKDLYDFLRLNHSKLLSYLEDLPDELFSDDAFTVGMIKNETYLHYEEHDENIKTFSKSLNY